MAFHLVAFSESVDQAAIAPIAAAADPSLTVSGDNVQVPDFAPYLMGALGLGVNQTRAQVNSPSLRRILNPEFMPTVHAAAPTANLDLINLFHNPLPLDVGEQLQFYAAEDGAGATVMNGFIWLGDGKVDVITDPIYSLRVTSAVATVATTWTNGAIVYDQVLPVGEYAIVGAEFYAANLLAFRFVFQGSTPRPGGIGTTVVDEYHHKGQRFGGFGVWGVFNHSTPPTVDFFSSAADAAEVGVLDLIKIG